ncbi:hypothetical protein K1719_017417 [Acacia pycnantha]|nr:hypothetical protein K1719_017417 [Acacia pycnantha]
MGRQPAYGFMLKKLRQFWERKGKIDVFDLENDFYLVNFQNSEDYMGEFARMCVELDLTKPLVPEFIVEGQKMCVVYESLSSLCTKCGWCGHNKDGCVNFHKKKAEGAMEVEAQDNLRKVRVKGAASKTFASVLKELRHRYKVDVVVILEPRISGATATKVIKSWGFKFSRRVEAVGFSGGIWILWNLEDLLLDVLISDEQFIHCRLKLGEVDMLFTVYANPCEQRRQQVRSLLREVAREVDEPWLVAGDFNEIKSPMEQKGGGRVNENRCHVFNEWIQQCELVDMEPKGPFFTWQGPKWDGAERVFKRLGRCLCNVKWLEMFEDARG